MRRPSRFLLLPAAALAPASAADGETSRPFLVSAQLVAGCVVATDVSGRWGAIDLGTLPGVAGGRAEGALVSTAGGGIAIECTPGVAATLSADGGDHADGGGGRRLMLAGGGATIGYALFADGAATPWTGTLPLTFAAGRRFVPVRAAATLAATAPAGRYSDTVRVTLSW